MTKKIGILASYNGSGFETIQKAILDKKLNAKVVVVITNLIALPKMKDYPFSVLLVDEANKELFPVQEDMISVISLENGKITDIKYVKTAEELGKILK